MKKKLQTDAQIIAALRKDNAAISRRMAELEAATINLREENKRGWEITRDALRTAGETECPAHLLDAAKKMAGIVYILKAGRNNAEVDANHLRNEIEALKHSARRFGVQITDAFIEGVQANDMAAWADSKARATAALAVEGYMP